MDEKEDAKRELKELFKRGGNKAYTILRHVSRSGMRRVISVYVIVDNNPVRVDWLIAQLGLFKLSKDGEGLIVDGCGSDMGFEVVYRISFSLFYKEVGDGRAGYVVKQSWI